GHLDRMGQARTQMIAGAVQKNLRLVLEPAKRARMNDPRAITLKFHPIYVARLRIFSPARVTRFLGKPRKCGALRPFHFLTRLVPPSLLAHGMNYSPVLDLGES